ncbi:hypothetical protein G6F59_016272 [Rhizopus arrhizus]|nr:hypothetical protein G6F59_016272 [Rhizopus arrhizus]
MLRFALSRIVMAVPTLLIVAVAVFVMIRLIPGDPAQLLLGDLETPAALADLRARLGLDQTWLTQFGIWFGNMLHGDLGSSINTGQPVLPLVWDRFLISGRVVVVAVLTNGPTCSWSVRQPCWCPSRLSGWACCC